MENNKVGFWSAFLRKNKTIIKQFSVGLVQKTSGKPAGEVSLKGRSDSLKITAVVRDNEVTGNSIHFAKLVDRTKDNCFDLISKFPEKFARVEKENLTKLRKNLRQTSAMPLLLIYLAEKKNNEGFICPLLYLEMPNFKGVAQGVSWVKKNRLE